jgi:glycosyltransferase involved in cell wall biosynthesis
MMKISCPVILKNEAATVFKTLKTVQPYIDEYVISIDESTTDGTLGEVRRFEKDHANGVPVTLMSHKWEGDFSKARNDLIEKCSHEYVLIIDGHEWLGKNRLKEIKENGKYDVYAAEINMHMNVGDSVMLQPRLFKKVYKYADASHNVLQMGDTKAAPLTLGSIHHKREDALSSERIRQRKVDNVKDLKKRARKGDRTALYRLGCEYMAYQDFPKAIKWFEKYMKGDAVEGERYQMMTNLAMCYYHDKKYTEAERVLMASQVENWENRNAHMVFLAELYLVMGDYFRGLYWSTLATGVNKPKGKFFTIYPAFYYQLPFDIMKRCYAKIGFASGVKECNKILEKINDNISS